MKQKDKSEIKVTGRLLEIFKKYGVKQPLHPKSVVHMAYGTSATIPPGVFATYEAAIKSEWVKVVKSQLNPKYASVQDIMWMARENLENIAEKDGFILPNEDMLISEKKAAEDQGYCVKLIIKSGYYYELLD